MKWNASLSLFLASMILIGCSGGNSTTQGTTGGGDGQPVSTINAPEAPTGEGEIKGELDVAAFQGGYDIDYYKKCGDSFAALHPDLKVKVWGDPRVWEQLRPKFAANTPPDLIFPGWGMDHWALVQEGQIMSLDKALDSKPAEGEGTWRDTFDPNLLKLCQLEGKTWMLPYYVMFYGWWYDENVFKANGWTAPTTWEELLALNEKIKAKGMAPITFQGKYPYYMIEGMLLPWAFAAGGPEAVRNAQNLEPGAWESPAILKAAQMIDELNQKGYFVNGAVGLSHTEAQMEMLLGKAAMFPCGSWVEAEMGKQMDEIAKSGKPRPVLRYFAPPVPAGTPEANSNLLIGIEPWMVTTKAKNPNAAVALYKHMTSLTNAKGFVTAKSSLMSIKGSDDVQLPAGLVSPAAAYKSAKTIWSNQCRSWYPELNKEIENALTALLNKEIKPEQFCERVEEKAEETRKDKEIKKHKVAF